MDRLENDMNERDAAAKFAAARSALAQSAAAFTASAAAASTAAASTAAASTAASSPTAALSAEIAEMVASARGTAELGRVLHGIHEFGDGPPPTPSRELAKLLASGLQVNAALPAGAAALGNARLRRAPRRRLGIAALIMVTLAASGGAAYANDDIRLAVETAVAQAVNTFTPFHVTVPKPEAPTGKNKPGVGSTAPTPAASDPVLAPSPEPAPTVPDPTTVVVPGTLPTTAPAPIHTFGPLPTIVPPILPNIIPSAGPSAGPSTGPALPDAGASPAPLVTIHIPLLPPLLPLTALPLG